MAAFKKIVTLTYAPGNFRVEKYYVKSLQGDGGFSIVKDPRRARVFLTQGMVDKAITHVQASLCGLPEKERPQIAEVAA